VSTKDNQRLIVDCQSQVLLLLLLLYSNVSFVLVHTTFGFLQDLEEAEKERRAVSKIDLPRQARIVIVASRNRGE
jgi:membrane glycosyltransferase